MIKLKELRKKNTRELNTRLLYLLREQFNLRVQVSRGQVRQTHLLKQVRRNIAFIKTLLTEKQNKGE